MKKEKKDPEKAHFFKAAIPAILFGIYVILDYLNVPQLLGLSSDRINMDFFDVFLNSVIVIVLYIITYFFVDSRQIQKDANAKDTADILLLYTYKECVDNLHIVLNPMWTKNYIAPKVDFNRPINKNSVVSNIQDLPFSSKSEIFELATGGYVEKEVLTRYLHIQAEYIYVVAMEITFFDLTNPKLESQRVLFDIINRRKDALLALLDEEIKRLEVPCDGQKRKAV